MVSGHTSSALLANTYRTGEWFDVWLFQRGLTSGLFLLLSGLAFSVATARHWPAHVRLSGAPLKRLWRFGLFIVLGYALHFPVSHVAELATATDQQWRSFLAVDVLQLIGVTFVVVQMLVMIVRTQRAFMVSAFVLAAAVTVAAPAVWGVDWARLLPLPIAAYLSPATRVAIPAVSLGGLRADWRGRWTGLRAVGRGAPDGIRELGDAGAGSAADRGRVEDRGARPRLYGPMELGPGRRPRAHRLVPRHPRDHCTRQPAHRAVAARVRRGRTGVARRLLRALVRGCTGRSGTVACTASTARR